MALKVILKSDGKEVVLPVTPEAVQSSFAWNTEKVNIHALGDVACYGERKMDTISVPFLIPSGGRSYAFSGGYTGNTYGFIEQLQTWMKEKKKVRYIVGDTGINDEVLIQSVEYGETDGTRDLSGTITLQQTQTVQVSPAGGSGRADEETAAAPAEDQNYTIQKGDTLWSIARQYYGDPQKCWQLAEYNGIQNANLIYAGDTIRIPDAGNLDGLTYSGSKGTVSVKSIDDAATAADRAKQSEPHTWTVNYGGGSGVWQGTVT